MHNPLLAVTVLSSDESVMSYSHIRSPSESSLVLSVPTEIRQKIYGYLFPSQLHASLCHGKINLSTCCEGKPGYMYYHDYEDLHYCGYGLLLSCKKM